MIATSPCTGICKLDDATGWCLGCGRSGGEIAEWRTQPEIWRSGIWDEIPKRLGQLGVGFRRLPWTGSDTRDFVASTLAAGKGTWVMGVVGAVAEFTAAPGKKVKVSLAGFDFVARTHNAAMRMTVDDDIRALAFDAPDPSASPRIVLVVKRGRARSLAAPEVTDLGDDQSALIRNEETRLFDLGLGRKEARFCVRVAPGHARDALDTAKGLPFAQALPLVGAALVAESPTRVIEMSLGRIEVQGHIPPPGSRSPEGSHTHLLPDHLATGRSVPVGMDIPQAYLPGAIFYPAQERSEG